MVECAEKCQVNASTWFHWIHKRCAVQFFSKKTKAHQTLFYRHEQTVFFWNGRVSPQNSSEVATTQRHCICKFWSCTQTWSLPSSTLWQQEHTANLHELDDLLLNEVLGLVYLILCPLLLCTVCDFFFPLSWAAARLELFAAIAPICGGWDAPRGESDDKSIEALNILRMWIIV